MIEVNILALLSAMGIPSAVTGFCFWLFQRKIQQRDKERDAAEALRREKEEREAAEHRKKEAAREKAREDLEMYLVRSISATITLGEATARAVQRIPDAHCNGDMTSALKLGACSAAASLSEVSASDGVKTAEEVLKLYDLYG